MIERDKEITIAEKLGFMKKQKILAKDLQQKMLRISRF